MAKIINAECIPLNIPFCSERVRRHMHRALTHNERVYVYRVESDDGHVGWGDSHTTHDPGRAIGKDPMEIMRCDELGYGLQIAVLDLAARISDVPVHALLGEKIRALSPISWWSIDMPGAEWADDLVESQRRGYTSAKLKARPWRDIIAQIEACSPVLPAGYQLDLDFNWYMVSADRSHDVLGKLDAQPNVRLYESPFRLKDDIDGARRLRQGTREMIFEHWSREGLPADCADGFVCGGALEETLMQDEQNSRLDKPYFLQMVGTGIMTAYVAHLESVLSHATIGAITCHELWEHDLLKKRLQVVDGHIGVSDEPGLGVEVDEQAVEKYRVDASIPTPRQRSEEQHRILRIQWPGPDGRVRQEDFTREKAYADRYLEEELPGFQPGVELQVIEENETPDFSKSYEALVAAKR